MIPDAPVPTSVQPSRIYNGEDTPILVLGEAFYPSLGVPASEGDAPSLTDGFAVILRLGGTRTAVDVDVDSVVLRDLGTLSGLVAQGLPPGRYDVDVVAPSGVVGRGFGLLDVTDTRVERVDLSVDAVFHPAGEEAVIEIRLLDPQGDPVEEDLELVVTVERPDDSDSLPTLAWSGLQDAELLEAPAIGLIGRTGPDGVATVRLNASEVGDYIVRVDATDELRRVQDDDLLLTWTRGVSLSTRIELPSPAFSTIAGEPFTALLTVVDEFGNVADDARVNLALKEFCGGWVESVSVQGRAELTVRPEGATGAGCLANRIEVFTATAPGASADFQVAPGPLAGFEVVTSPSQLVAGQSLNAFITPVDAFGNPATWSGTLTTVDDGVGGLGTVRCVPDAVTYCEVRVLLAGQRRSLTVVDDQGVRGTGGLFTVLPAAPASLAVGGPSAPVVAGTPFDLPIEVEDAYGNLVTDHEVRPGSIQVRAGTTAVACTPSGSPVQRLQCLLERADLATTLRVDAEVTPTGGGTALQVSGVSSAFAVGHGPLARAQLTVAAGPLTAGVPFDLSIVGFDAYDNPYTPGTSTSVSLSDTSGTVSPVAVALDGQGTAVVPLRITRAGATTVVASRASAVLGTSQPLQVRVGPASRLVVRPLDPWAWVGEPAEVRVDVTDDFGNRVVVDDLVTLESASDKAMPSSVVVVNGTGIGTLTWTDWDPTDEVMAASSTDPSLYGTSPSLAVLARCGPSGPVADVRFSGRAVGRVCVGPGAMLTGDLAASVAVSGTQLIGYGLAVEGTGVTTTSSQVSVPITQPGIYEVRGVAIQSNGCADEVTTEAYASPDDGSPVGPIRVLPTATSMTLGPTSAPLRVDLRDALDCAGRPAALAPVQVRTDRGRLLGVAPTGTGLVATLDAIGGATVQLDVSSDLTGGVAHLVAWTPDGTARGSAQVQVFGDLESPTVWSQNPEGPVAGPVDVVTLGFSEAIDPSTVDASTIVLLGAASLPYTVTMPDPRTVRLLLQSPAVPGPVAWSVLVSEEVTDLAGNPLAGTWQVPDDRYVGFFGAAEEVAPVASCSLDRGLFRPDGDDGVGPEADGVTLTFNSVERAAWWVVRVLDANNTPVRVTQIPNGASSGTFYWDGRDVTGRIVDPGFYTLEVDTEGVTGGRGGSCRRVVETELEVPR